MTERVGRREVKRVLGWGSSECALPVQFASTLGIDADVFLKHTPFFVPLLCF